MRITLNLAYEETRNYKPLIFRLVLYSVCIAVFFITISINFKTYFVIKSKQEKVLKILITLKKDIKSIEQQLRDNIISRDSLKSLNQAIHSANSLQKLYQVSFSYLLYLIEKCISKNVSITSLNIHSDFTGQIDGRANSGKDVTKFFEKLKNSKGLSNVSLNNTRFVWQNQKRKVLFSVSFKINRGESQ